MKRNKKIFNRNDFACKPLLGGVPESIVRQERYLDGSRFRWGKTSFEIKNSRQDALHQAFGRLLQIV